MEQSSQQFGLRLSEGLGVLVDEHGELSMSRMVFCKKYQKEMEGLDAPPYPGPKGQEVFEHVSKQAWQDWQSHQTMLINEKHLSLVNPEARKYLQGEMDKYFSGEDYDKAEGYVPPTK